MNIFDVLFGGRPEPSNEDEMFRLKVPDAYEQYRNLQKRLCEDAQVNVLFRYVRSLPNGATGGFSERKANDQLDLIRIVSIELFEYDKFASMREDMDDDVISGSDVVGHVLMHRHEVEHAKQVSWLRAGVRSPYFTEVQFGDDYITTGNMYMGLLRVSERLNPFWYQGKDEKPNTLMNYWSNPLEIMSERAAIEDGPRLLKKMFPGASTQDCESAVLDYVDRQCFGVTILGRRVPRKYFIQLPSDWRSKGMSVDDVLKVFDEACRKGFMDDFLDYCRTRGEAARAAKANEQLSMSGVSDVVPVLTPEERRMRLEAMERKQRRQRIEKDALGTIQGSDWVEREVRKSGTSAPGPEQPGRKDGGPDYT